MLGVKTIGNATLIAFDDGPILATDPWFGDEDEACFGSWGLTHEIPAAEKADIQAAKYIWFSHGHPDHLNPISVQRLRHASLLLPDHVGNRIKHDLEFDGYKVSTLPDGRWVQLSKRIRVFCVSDYIQDAALLVDVGGRLFINMNDCNAHARLGLIAKVVRQFRYSYLLRLSGYGGADLINFYGSDGIQIERALDRRVGRFLAQYARRIGARSVIPFSSFHQYRREDSAWANAYMPPISAYRDGFDERLAEFINPFAWVDCSSGEVVELKPDELPVRLRRAEDCGDSWSDELDADDRRLLDDYCQRKEALREKLGFVTFVVGGKSHTVDVGDRAGRGITFHVPRNSLMTAVSNRVFDDLVLGGFMKIIPSDMDFHRDFIYITTKYSDNGCAETKDELRSYFAEYKRRSGTAWVLHHLIKDGHTLFRRYARRDSKLYTLARDVYVRALRN